MLKQIKYISNSKIISALTGFTLLFPFLKIFACLYFCLSATKWYSWPTGIVL